MLDLSSVLRAERHADIASVGQTAQHAMEVLDREPLGRTRSAAASAARRLTSAAAAMWVRCAEGRDGFLHATSEEEMAPVEEVVERGVRAHDAILVRGEAEGVGWEVPGRSVL